MDEFAIFAKKIISIDYQYQIVFQMFLKKKKKKIVFQIGPINHCYSFINFLDIFFGVLDCRVEKNRVWESLFKTRRIISSL